MRLRQVRCRVVNRLLRQQLWLGTFRLSRYTLSMHWAELWPLRRMVLFNGELILRCLSWLNRVGRLVADVMVLIRVKRLVTGLSFMWLTLLAVTKVPNSSVTWLVPALGLGRRVDRLLTTVPSCLRVALRRLAKEVNLVPLVGTLNALSYWLS